MNWTEPDVYIFAADAQSQAKAQHYATLSGLPLSSDLPAAWHIRLTQHKTELTRPDGLAVDIDFVKGKATRRASESNFKKQPLARALGLQKWKASDNAADELPHIIDATAGFGTDAWMMASLGCNVTLLEQSPALFVLLTDAIEIAQQSGLSADTASRLTLTHVNSTHYLNEEATPSADIIYLDPMYPTASKQALVKKGMQLLHELIGPVENNQQLLTASLNKARYRVVVKRPKGAPQLEGSEHWTGQLTSVESPNTRFDVYHIASAL